MNSEPNIALAIKRGLQMVVAMGHSQQEIAEFINSAFGSIWDRRVHIPIAGDIAKGEVQHDIAAGINQLLTEN